jgi:hypothetical protein
MNMNRFNLYPLNYTIVYCSSSDPNFPIENINKKSRYSDFIELSQPQSDIESNNNIINSEKYKNIYFNPGWSSLRFCSYPQMIIVQLSSLSDIKQINIELNHERVPQKIDVYVYCPTILKEVVTNFKNIITAKFTYIGSVIPVNHNYNQRELKKLIFHNQGNYDQITIMNCLYAKFLLHKNYPNDKNKFEQVGIVNIDIFGNHTNKILPILPLKQVEPFKNDEILPRLKGLYRDSDYDDYIREKIEKAKMEYYSNETLLQNEEKRNKIYQDITLLRELGQKVLELNKEKTKFEYFGNDTKLIQINAKLKEIRDYIESTYPYYGKENVKYENKNIDEEFKINVVEENLNESKNVNNISNTNINNISGNNIVEEENIYMEDNNINNDNVNNINDIENNFERYKVNEVNERSKEILRRHQEKQRMIKENMEMAEQNRKKQ